MKKLFLSFLMTLILSANSYSQKEINYETVDMENSDRSLPMPNGTKIFENEDGSYLVSLPEGYEYILKSVGSDEIVTAAGGSVTCTCNKENGGCHPCKAAGQYGCMMKTCTNCTKGAIMNPGGGNKEYDIIGIKSKDISPLRFLASSKLGDKALDFFSTDEVPYFNNCVEGIFNYGEAKETLNAYFTKFFSAEDANKLMNGQDPSVEVVYCLADFYGNTLVVAVPKSAYNDDILTIAFGKMDCKCNTKGDCPAKGGIGYSYCDATNCKSCSGANIIKNSNGGLTLER